MNRRVLAALTTVAVAAIVVGAVVIYFRGPTRGSVQSASQSPVVGKAEKDKTAPQFEVATTAGYFDPSKTRKPVFLEVFATWCPHCQRETAVIDRLYAKYRNRVDFVAVSGSDTAMDGTSASSIPTRRFGTSTMARFPTATSTLRLDRSCARYPAEKYSSAVGRSASQP